MIFFNFELKTYPDNYKVNKLPLDPARVYIAVMRQLTKEVDGEKFIAVSDKCYTLKEVDEEVDVLIKELKEMKKEAKAFFDKERQTRSKTVDKP